MDERGGWHLWLSCCWPPLSSNRPPPLAWTHLARCLPSCQVTDFLNSGREPPAWYKQKKREARARQRAEQRRRRWRVVVVGAGPSGLTAALHLKVSRGWATEGLVRGRCWGAESHWRMLLCTGLCGGIGG